MVSIDAATIAARRRNRERSPKTRPRSSSWPDLTSIRVVAVIRLRGTWVGRMMVMAMMILMVMMVTVMMTMMAMMTNLTRNKLMIVDL